MQEWRMDTKKVPTVSEALAQFEHDCLQEAANCAQLANDVRERARLYELECLRQASDCTQLAQDVQNRALEIHFLHMAKVWTARAELGPENYLGKVIH